MSGICVFSIKLTKLIVSFIKDSCFIIGIDCSSEPTKLEMRCVGPLLSETIGLLTSDFL